MEKLVRVYNEVKRLYAEDPNLRGKIILTESNGFTTRRPGCWSTEHSSKDGLSFCTFHHIIAACMTDWAALGRIAPFAPYREDLVMAPGRDVMTTGEEDDGVYVSSGNSFGKYPTLHEQAQRLTCFP